MGVLGHFSQLPDLVPTRGPGLSIWVPVISFTILASKQTNILLFYLCARCIVHMYTSSGFKTINATTNNAGPSAIYAAGPFSGGALRY